MYYNPQGLLRVLAILFSCYFSIRSFYYVLSVSIFYSKVILFSLLPVVRLSSSILDLRGSLNKFPDFFVWALLLIVHT